MAEVKVGPAYVGWRPIVERAIATTIVVQIEVIPVVAVWLPLGQTPHVSVAILSTFTSTPRPLCPSPLIVAVVGQSRPIVEGIVAVVVGLASGSRQ